MNNTKMSPENFVFWLQGYFEITEETHLKQHQVKIIKNHLDLVFTKVTPAPTLAEIMAKEIKKRPEDIKYC